MTLMSNSVWKITIYFYRKHLTCHASHFLCVAYNICLQGYDLPIHRLLNVQEIHTNNLSYHYPAAQTQMSKLSHFINLD